MFPKVVLGLFVLIFLALVGAGFFLPNTYRIERSTIVDAERAAVHAVLADLNAWPDWSLWQRARDPQARFEVQGSGRDVGARLAWQGEASGLGEGVITITDSDPQRGVSYDLAHNGRHTQGALTLDRFGVATEITWSAEGVWGSKPLGGWVALLAGGSIESVFADEVQVALSRLKRRVEGN